MLVLLFCEKQPDFFISSVEQERLFLLCQIGRGLPNFKGAFCLGAGKIYVRREIWQIFQFTSYYLKVNVNQENLISLSGRLKSVTIFYNCYATIKRWRWKIRISGCRFTIRTQKTPLMSAKFTFSVVSWAWFMHVHVTDSLWLTTILLCSNAPTNEARTIEFKFEFEFG